MKESNEKITIISAGKFEPIIVRHALSESECKTIQERFCFNTGEYAGYSPQEQQLYRDLLEWLKDKKYETVKVYRISLNKY